jgi:hypothetical protein
MNHKHPTLAELRDRVFKHSAGGVERGHWLARRWARPAAIPVTWLAVRLSISAHVITLMAFSSYLSAALALGSGTRPGFVAGAILAFIGYLLDHVDGQVARWSRSASLTGTYLDYLMHHAVNLALGFALGFGLALRLASPAWAALGFLLGASLLLLPLHEDCRYKSLFQRLKRDACDFLVHGRNGVVPVSGAQNRPFRPRILLEISQTAFEHPNQLLILAGLAILALFAPIPVWILAWRLVVLGLAFLGPILVAGRVARAVVTASPDREFDAWFQPIGGSDQRSAAA